MNTERKCPKCGTCRLPHGHAGLCVFGPVPPVTRTQLVIGTGAGDVLIDTGRGVLSMTPADALDAAMGLVAAAERAAAVTQH